MADMGDMTVERVKLSELNPAEYNPRKMSGKARQGLDSSLGRFGVMQPIVWNKRTGNIVGGHQRYKVLVDAGEEETDVVVVDLDMDGEVALNITLNSEKLRGDFTSEVIGLLEVSEAQLGNTFKELGLIDLHKLMKQSMWAPGDNHSSSSSSNTGGDDEPPPDLGEPTAVITCPHCKSRWKMSNSDVLYNGTLEGEDEPE